MNGFLIWAVKNLGLERLKPSLDAIWGGGGGGGGGRRVGGGFLEVCAVMIFLP